MTKDKTAPSFFDIVSPNSNNTHGTCKSPSFALCASYQFDNVYPMSGEDIGCMERDVLPNNNNNIHASWIALSCVLGLFYGWHMKCTVTLSQTIVSLLMRYIW